MRALADGVDDLVYELDRRIEANGGLQTYQIASKIGQSKERGGDSSKVLVGWLDETLLRLKSTGLKLRVLEVGALSTKNACSMTDAMSVTRIDLHSQEAGILQQDFMERPLPSKDADTFHLISLSLVLNYVSDPAARGEMLRRTTKFLTPSIPLPEPQIHKFLPCLFLVLPAACVRNSRYFTEDRLSEIMASLGFSMIRRKLTAKLAFYLWKHITNFQLERDVFGKKVLNPGRTRNNFTITLKQSQLEH
jgi:25S rRNA (adenine2142-N1)-methyltransferase